MSKRSDQLLALRVVKFDLKDLAKIRSLPGRRWLPDELLWTVPYTIRVIDDLAAAFAGNAVHVNSELLEECDRLQENAGSGLGRKQACAIKFFFYHVLGQRESAPYIRPKKENKLPNVLAVSGVLLVLKALNNLKHRAILFLTYSSGLRVGEVVRLRKKNFDPERKTMLVRQGKAGKIG